ncbi:single-stranded-DNA-specific exonuclease RecJ [Pelagibacteraceae bacterium]|nr:single-stranded-DNA-specific exonuclease RecJ [Candidatus Pelagibacter sp.]MDC1491080.1 single-stranded-DNA-specific exonuclease RecJ [Pelagibacteraceae bacterium]
MISVSGKIWTEQKVNKNLIEKFKQDHGLSNILSKLIISRNYDASEIFGINNYQKLINIFKDDKDFDKASLILINAIKNNENICILGDYDVDGACSTSLLVRYLNYINQKHFFYIPDRTKDGYGASKKLFQKLILKKPKLIIMVDCGSTSNDAIEYLNKNNIKSIIIDHHEINKPYPKSNAIINPKKETIKKENSLLCATALTYFFIEIIIKKTKSNFKISNFLIYVLLATICDVMPLRKINKIIAHNTIDNFKIQNNLALNHIFEQFNLKKKLTTDDLGFLIGPIINSGGRLNKSNYGVKLLSTDNLEIIKDRSSKLIALNNKRKIIEQSILDEIDFEKIKKENKNVVIYYKDNLNEGLIGIIASRLKDYFNKPSIVITKSGNIFKASARSTTIYNIGNLIKLLIDNKIIDNGGGHNMAAGFSMKKNNIKLLDNFIQKDFKKKISYKSNSNKYDLEISLSAIKSKFVQDINKLGPFGNFNFLPIFLIKNLKVIKLNVIKDKHISAILKPDTGASIRAICFNCLNSKLGHYLLNYKKKINIIAQIHENIWNNKKTIQLNIKDLIL